MDKDTSDRLRFDPSGSADYHYNDPLLRFLRSPRKEVPTPDANDEAGASASAEPTKPDHSLQSANEPIRFEWRIDEVPKECTSCAGNFLTVNGFMLS